MATATKTRPNEAQDAVDDAAYAVAQARDRVEEIGQRRATIASKRQLRESELAKLRAKRSELLLTAARAAGRSDDLEPLRGEIVAAELELGELAEMEQALDTDARAAQAELAAAERVERGHRGELAQVEYDVLLVSLNASLAEVERKWRIQYEKGEQVHELTGRRPDALEHARNELRDSYLTWAVNNGHFPRMPVVGQRRFR
jgi:hypothetical protein